MTNERVAIAVDDHVAVVTLNRPEKHNALDGPMFEGIVAAARDVAARTDVRAVVLHGAGPSFCSGLDVSAFASIDGILERPPGQRSNLAQRTCTGWVDVPAPVIAAVHGNCFGGGLQIALGADIRFASPDARLSVMESRWGLVPDMGITSTLPRLVRIDIAKELTFTGRVISGTEAAALGLVTRVAEDPLAAAKEMAAEIASRSPDATRAAKRLYDSSWHGPVEDGLLLETELQTGLIGSPNQIEAVRAGVGEEAAKLADGRGGTGSRPGTPTGPTGA